jgi:hypothetical protein
MQLMTLNMTRVTPSEYGIQRGSDCPLRVPCLNPGSWRWLTRCLCQTHRGHCPDHLPSSCSLRWWHLSSTARCGGSQFHAELLAGRCSAPPSYPERWGGGDAQVFQQSLKPTGGNRSFCPEGLHLVCISVYPLDLCVARGRVLPLGLVFYVDVR